METNVTFQPVVLYYSGRVKLNNKHKNRNKNEKLAHSIIKYLYLVFWTNSECFSKHFYL